MLAIALHIDSGTELFASKDSVLAKLLLDSQDLVQLGQTLRSRWCTGLDLAGSDAHGNVGDGDVLRFTRSVRYHHAPAGSIRVFGRLDGLRQGPDLVDLEEECVARLQLDGLLNADRIRDGQIITMV